MPWACFLVTRPFCTCSRARPRAFPRARPSWSSGLGPTGAPSTPSAPRGALRPLETAGRLGSTCWKCRAFQGWAWGGWQDRNPFWSLGIRTTERSRGGVRLVLSSAFETPHLLLISLILNFVVWHLSRSRMVLESPFPPGRWAPLWSPLGQAMMALAVLLLTLGRPAAGISPSPSLRLILETWVAMVMDQWGFHGSL